MEDQDESGGEDGQATARIWKEGQGIGHEHHIRLIH